MVEERYIRCKILPGLFETELYVSVLGSSVYVDKSVVRVIRDPQGDEPGEGMVLAYLVKWAGDKVLVELTGEPVTGGLRTWIPAADFAVV